MTQAFPFFVSASEVYAVMPSTVTAGPATLRLTYESTEATRSPFGSPTPGPAFSQCRVAATAPASS